jgi:hypothetical protein
MTGPRVRVGATAVCFRLMGLLVWLGACGQGGPVGPPIEPLIDLGSRHCAVSVDNRDASVLAMTPSRASAALVDIAAAGPCWRLEQGDALFHAFVLPASDKPLVATIASLPAGRALLAPRVLVLDAAGRTTREIPFDAFQFRGDAFRDYIRLCPDDRMLVVASSPDMVGRAVDLIQGRIAAYPTFGGGTILVGSDANAHYVWSHTGRVHVALDYLPDVRTGQ